MAASGRTFLSIREAADYLSVDEEAVNRLIRQGRLPVDRAAGVYCVRQTDLESFLDAQRSRGEGGATGDVACSSCRRSILSPLSIGGRCGECDAPICLTCWQIDGRRRCAEHQATPAAAPQPGALLRCARCARVVPGGAPARTCEAEGCERPLCIDCWEQRDGHFCGEHAPAADAQFAAAERRLRAGEVPCLVTSVEARKRELAAIARFDRKVRQATAIRNPVSGRTRRVLDWGQHHAAGDETRALLDLLQAGRLDRDLLARVPVNSCSRYLVSDGDSPGLLVELAVLSHLEAHVRQGFDVAPASLADLLPQLERRAREAEERRLVWAVGLAATTGWDPEATAYVQADSAGRSYSHRLLLPYLIDLQSDALVCNTLDQRVVPLQPLFTPQLDGEAFERLVNGVRQALANATLSSLTVAQAAAALDSREDERAIVRAFRRLAESGEYTVETISGLGLVISRR